MTAFVGEAALTGVSNKIKSEAGGSLRITGWNLYLDSIDGHSLSEITIPTVDLPRQYTAAEVYAMWEDVDGSEDRVIGIELN